jgi:TetR/AcrR family transcriptional regulator, transcriptional repressor for nem operon
MVRATVSAKAKLLDAAMTVIRSKGYSATTVDDLCAAAQVTKGAFFHHFESKEALGVAAADHWTHNTAELFAAAPYHRHPDPLDRVLGYIDFRKQLLQGKLPEFTCLVGTMVQETFDTVPAIREACKRSIVGHAEAVQLDIAAAMRAYKIKADWSAASLALHTQAVLQGAFILAKAQRHSAVAVDSIDHLQRYIRLLFQKPSQKTGAPKR